MQCNLYKRTFPKLYKSTVLARTCRVFTTISVHAEKMQQCHYTLRFTGGTSAYRYYRLSLWLPRNFQSNTFIGNLWNPRLGQFHISR